MTLRDCFEHCFIQNMTGFVRATGNDLACNAVDWVYIYMCKASGIYLYSLQPADCEFRARDCSEPNITVMVDWVLKINYLSIRTEIGVMRPSVSFVETTAD